MVDLSLPLIVQSDRTVMLEVATAQAAQARSVLARFAELEKSPEHVHTYRVSPLSLWHAANAGLTASEVVHDLTRFAKYGVPASLVTEINELMGRVGKLRLAAADTGFKLTSTDPMLALELSRSKGLEGILTPDDDGFRVPLLMRGALKQKLARLGYPLDDRAGFVEGEALAFQLRDVTLAGKPFAMRAYQTEAVAAAVDSGSGVIVLPCGAGKTVVGMATAAAHGKNTLILCTNVTSARQWISEILDKTTLTSDQVGEYSGKKKQILPVTVATYQILSRRHGDSFQHLELFSARDWGLILYDEVHLLPAPIFRVTAELQARRRIGLTATLVREDGLETDVYALIGPKRYEVPWREMEQLGFIAAATCRELRVALPDEQRIAYVTTADEPREQYRIAAENPLKDLVVEELLTRHAEDGVLVIGQYLRQLNRVAKRLGAPLITGETPEGERERLYTAFRKGEVRLLVVSKVANFSIDLPDASVCIQISGSFGSRQEEAQRLGRILRPKARQAFFYSLVSSDTEEMRFAMNRQLFLTEQGYRYDIETWTPAPHGALAGSVA